ncbi:carboxypeptidase-like regulatory domain-containing protein [Aquimarina sp. ERC-38]|uniref:carboxypeptidase-like regulatory domain-containing protein n=1 Tax=Aquimarina sp. ERC-38 TaxID=2949996 RepID=UPI0022471751|nr:carboxypeptidase-like regulatory domain-containing protein [Aquimarina sp. ERC-38]UZO80753.1 carboxypeptidase-like regulatory domain-containing protein [Aquimarina sp. ERC-38]
MKFGYYLLLLLCTLPFCTFAQEEVAETPMVSGKVLNAANDVKLESVHVVNLNKVKGTITNDQGDFTLSAEVDDTLYFTYIGFKPIKIRVTNDWIRFGAVKIKMTELGIALEEVVVADVQLTGYLEIDAKRIPIYNNYRYSISGLSRGYEGGSRQPGAFNKVLKSIFNPADFLYNVFSKKGNEMRKMRKMKEDDEIRNLLETKFDRETLMALLQIEKLDIDEILRNCNYSADFINFANDLQILDAISECYENYKTLNRK